MVHARRVRHLEPDLLVRFVVDDRQSGQAVRDDLAHQAGGFDHGLVQPAWIGRIIADRALAMDRDEVEADVVVCSNIP